MRLMNPYQLVMKKQVKAIVFTIVVSTLTNIAYADTMKQVFEQAWLNSTQGRVAKAKLDEVAASRVVAGALFPGSPQLELSNLNDVLVRNRGEMETNVGISVPLWLPGQKAARLGVAESEGKENQLSLEAARLVVAGELRAAVWAVYLSKSESEILAQRLETAEKLESDVAKRLKFGDVARTDFLLSKQETVNARIAIADAKSRLINNMQRYKVLTHSEILPDNPQEAVGAVNDGVLHPLLAAGQANSELAQAQLSLAQQSRRDAPTVGVLYRNQRDGSNTSARDTLGLALTIPFSSDVRNAPLLAKANTALAEVDARNQRVIAEIEANQRDAEAQLESAQTNAQLSVEREQVASERLSLMQRSYQLGETSLVELIRTQSQATEARIELARSSALLFAAQANIIQARGITP
jgi:cobalt-zinc-cadmium efflux system outer membrane protein